MDIKYSRYELGLIGGTFAGLFATSVALTFLDFKDEPRYIVFGIASIVFVIIYIFYKKQLKRQELNNGHSPE